MEYKEEKVIQFAKSLEDRAELMLFGGTLLGFVKGVALGGAAIIAQQAGLLNMGFETGPTVLTAGAVMAFFGFRAASREGLILRFQAHSIMCAVQTERNTRPHQDVTT